MEIDIEIKFMQLGFTKLESQIYLYLLINGPQTGYAVAKGIDKAVANVYKGVESLVQKGALEQAAGDSKLCSALPWQQLLDREKAKYDANLASLSKSFSSLPRPHYDEEIYYIKNIDHLKEKANEMIKSARSIILADLEPAALPWFQETLLEAASRGIEIRVKLYQAADLDNINITLRQNGSSVYSKTQDTQFSISVDGEDMLKALVNTQGNNVIQAFHSRNALMALMLYNQLLYELVLTDLKKVIPTGDLDAAKKILSETEHLHPFSSENTAYDNFNKKYKNQRD